MNGVSREAIVSSLRREGYCLLSGFAADVAESLRREHQRIFEERLVGVAFAEPGDGEQIYSSTVETLQELGLDNLARCLGADWFADVAARYFRAAPDAIGEAELVSFTLDGPKESLDNPGNHWPHWDPYLSLRLMLYVSDVTRENGAVEIKPGTHRDNHRRRMHEWRAGMEYAGRPICAGDDIAFQPVEARAGSVILFDTSITHRRGLVAEGRERRVAFNYLEAPLGRLHREGEAYALVPAALRDIHF